MHNGQINGYSATKVFTATKAREREGLGEAVTEWLLRNQALEVVDTAIKQSSDEAFHCLSIVLFLKPRSIAGGAKAA